MRSALFALMLLTVAVFPAQAQEESFITTILPTTHGRTIEVPTPTFFKHLDLGCENKMPCRLAVGQIYWLASSLIASVEASAAAHEKGDMRTAKRMDRAIEVERRQLREMSAALLKRYPNVTRPLLGPQRWC